MHEFDTKVNVVVKPKAENVWQFVTRNFQFWFMTF